MDADERDHPRSTGQIAVKPKTAASFLSNDHAAGYWILILAIPALLAFASMLLAGIDGIQNKTHPGDPADKDLYDLEPEEDKKIPTVCHSLDMALDYLDKDRGFLKAGGVFTDDLIDAYIELKMKEVTRVRMTTHPIEVEMYYSL